jgi:hypothetical protein
VTGWGWVRRVGLVIVAVALIEYLAVPQLVKARSELQLFADANPWLLLSAFVLEACSLMAYTSLTRAVLVPSVRPSFTVQLRIDLTGLGASHLLPGGGASASALRYRLMTARGVPAADAFSMAAVQTVIGVIGLVATFTGGVVLASPGIWSHPGYVLAGLVGFAALVALYAGSRNWRFGAWVARRTDRAAGAVREIALRAKDLLRQRSLRRALIGWAMANWLFDATSLWCCLWAYGVVVHPGALLVAYGAANLAGLLPLTPGGLGVVEGILIPTLTLLGAAGGPVVLGVLTWRALEFWLPIPVSGFAYASLRPWRNRPVAPAPSRPQGADGH